MSSKKRYWKDLGELHQDPAAMQGRDKEFATPLPIDEVLGDPAFSGAVTGRRDFLKFLGFGIGAATLAACETPVIKSIPYLNKPESITPGVALWYATTYYDGQDLASILVKTREGRPIHITGNPRHGFNHDPKHDAGSINARINSSVLGLYDNERLKGPMTRNATGGFDPISWSDADAAVTKGLAEVRARGGRTVVLTNTVISPTTKQVIQSLRNASGTALEATEGLQVNVGGPVDHVQYDTISYSGITTAHMKVFGKRAMPSYDLSKADVIVGVECDFLGTWGSTTEYSWQYASRRRPENGAMNRHWQFEARMSLTGASADERVPVKLSGIPDVLIGLHDLIASKTGGERIGGGSEDPRVAKAADELIAARGRALVLCGSNNEGAQSVVARINQMLGAYGTTADIARSTTLYQGDDAQMASLIQDMKSGRVGALIIAGVNPSYSLPNAEEFNAALEQVGLVVSMSGHADETASRSHVICPDHHYLESWNDMMPKEGHFALAQPVIRPLFNTRQWQESLMRWAGETGSYHDRIREGWRTALAGVGNFEEIWQRSLHDSVYAMEGVAPVQPDFALSIPAAAAKLKASVQGAGEWELCLYASEAIGDGQHANIPWLQEMPDPLTKITWDNYVCMAPADVKRLGLQMYLGEQSPASVVALTVNGKEIRLPVVPAPGQKAGTISVALGYGRGANGERVGRAACMRNDDGEPMPVGQNAYPFTALVDGAVSYSILNVGLETTGEHYPIAITQTHLTAMDRHSVVKETTFDVWDQHQPGHTYNHAHELAVHEDVNEDGVIDARDKRSVREFDLWEEFPVEGVGHRWGMSIDLNSCTGCSACITACTSENNVPVVGKDEVRRSREMHWLRLDRYYSSDMTKERAKAEDLGTIDMYVDMEVPSEEPRVVFMPVMCQHCNHAPCETVCPVAATTHSNEGLNQMAYNRCIGTRYCANNCPYKVRRFNWFNYVSEDFAEVNPAWDDLGRMVLNPDVVVRSRGVIEKCSMCVQRIQAGKLEAKKAGTPVPDGSIQTACAAACGNGAILFGDLNDKNSRVHRSSKEERAYHMLEEIGVQPNVNYLAKVRNAPAGSMGHATEVEHDHA